MDDLTREFLLESQEGLDRMERCLTELETRPGDAELLGEIFRAVHTIKGTTGFLGFSRLEALSHAGENLLGLLRDGRLAANAEIISGLLTLMDRLRGVLRSIESVGAEGENAPEDAATIAQLVALQREGVGVAAVVIHEPEMVGAVAAPARVRKARKSRSGHGSGRGKRVAPLLVDAAWSTAGEAGPPTHTGATAPVKAMDEPEPQRSASSEAGAGSGRPAKIESPAKAEPAETAPAVATSGGTADSTLRVDVDLLNRMMNLVGELVLTRNQILQATSANAGFALLGRRLDMVTADLREAVMKARMQPVSHVFSRFPRLVRDLALGLHKQVKLELEGQETELDKSLLEAIRDPLTHAIRNCIDHGIEMPEVRVANGKPAEGTVRLRAYHEGSHVMVEVHDDGAGMNIERIREKAVERGLVPAARAEQMSEREILQLIFCPGSRRRRP